ncbi:glycosyltransferase [Wenyingzhuangia aestuarii]|uniref:glycosyltransferase n=1 Tax=Wenyingzhuangia aestuarii TaxID=1647582 RepID=UPI00143C0F42|nr:glycosyltransferase [Wenyingzhuangia aestuarii]NJB82461.1 glycosyltransferase involved in cell wall biosynthesis [Wenyingzhuangia aestuarii]
MHIRIIHIVLGKGNPNRQNGVNKVVNSIANCQAENGIDTTLWGISFSQEHNYPERKYKTVLFKDHAHKFTIDESLYKAIDQLKGSNVVIHIHGAFIPQFYKIAKRLKKHNIPYVYTPHGAYNLKALQKSKWSKYVYIKLFESFIVNNAKAIQLLGFSEKKGTLRYFKKANITIIPNGQNLNIDFYNVPNHTKLHLGFLGRIDIETKGLDILLTALSKFKTSNNVQLHIIGSGGEMQDLQKIITEKQLEDLVILEGAKFDKDKFNTLNNLDVLCLTSRNEGLPGAVLEAASVGTPVLISKETNLETYVTNHQAGWVLKENTPAEIEESLLKIMDIKKENQLRGYKKNALKMIENDFEWNKIINLLHQVYTAS